MARRGQSRLGAEGPAPREHSTAAERSRPCVALVTPRVPSSTRGGGAQAAGRGSRGEAQDERGPRPLHPVCSLLPQVPLVGTTQLIPTSQGGAWRGRTSATVARCACGGPRSGLGGPGATSHHHVAGLLKGWRVSARPALWAPAFTEDPPARPCILNLKCPGYQGDSQI